MTTTTTLRLASCARSDNSEGLKKIMLSDALESVQGLYEIPQHDLVGEVLIPALRIADRVDIAVGYFSSLSLAALAPGLTELAERGVQCRLLLSPELSKQDLEAIERGVRAEDIINPRLADFEDLSSSALAQHCADLLAYLVAREVISIRCVLMEHGMFHKKVWLLREGIETVAVHGSGNLTNSGMFVNGEQMTVDCSWWSGAQMFERIQDLGASFEAEWNNEREEFLTIYPEQMIAVLRGRGLRRTAPPTIEDFWAAWRSDHEAGLEPTLPPGVPNPAGSRRLVIPEGLKWSTPPYEHQAEAVHRLEAANGSGLLAVATGGGKTKIALIAASRIQDSDGSSCFVLIVVPTRVLVRQWTTDVREFNIEPVLLSDVNLRERQIALASLAIRLGASEHRTEVMIVTQQLYTGDEALRQVCVTLAEKHCGILIVDEAHNAGASGFMADPPRAFPYRVGLSATPVRQYDAAGTVALFELFGGHSEPVFSFTVRDAIQAGCLTPYEYFLHVVDFSDEEMERFEELTDRLARCGWDKDDLGVDSLTELQKRILQERRGLVEQAHGKIKAFREVLATRPQHVDRSLVYCSAKAVRPPHRGRQIEAAISVLQDLHISCHQYTAKESGSPFARSILEAFGRNEYKVLAAMQVLDEGVDVPEARAAYLLASSTVEREWIQRRGRVLRRAPGKGLAEIHDFIVVPPSGSGGAGQTLLRTELRRAEHFAADSANAWAPGGPQDVLATIKAHG
ncbi:MAG: DEAD/DEAH box helicase family protein [Actinomycetes bacterium]